MAKKDIVDFEKTLIDHKERRKGSSEERPIIFKKVSTKIN